MARSGASVLSAALFFLWNAGVLPAESPAQHFPPTGKDMIPLNSDAGRRLLCESEAQDAYWNLTQFYSSQENLNTCAVAACLMVLNALPVERPDAAEYRPYKMFTPGNFFNKDVAAIVTRKKVSSSGMTLEQMSKVLQTFPVRAEATYASESDIETFRKALKKLSGPEGRPQAYIIVNYLRGGLGQGGGGHISPLAAYNRKEDVVLILDTANYKLPWVWVKTSRLWKAMAEGTDPESKRSRGYVTVATRSK